MVQNGDCGFGLVCHIREYEWTVSVDIQDAYLHVPHGKACTEISRGEWSNVLVCVPPVRLGYLPSGIYQVNVTSGPVRRLAHQSLVSAACQNLYRLSTAGVLLSISASPTWYSASISNLSACSSPTPWHPCPRCGSRPCWTIGDAAHGYSSRSPLNVGHVDLPTYPCDQRSVSPPPNPVVAVRGLVPGDGGLVRPDPSSFDHSPSGGLVGLSCSVAAGFTECPRDRVDSIHRCLQPQAPLTPS